MIFARGLTVRPSVIWVITSTMNAETQRTSVTSHLINPQHPPNNPPHFTLLQHDQVL